MNISREYDMPVCRNDEPPKNVREINKVILVHFKLFIYIHYVYNTTLTMTFIYMSFR